MHHPTVLSKSVTFLCVTLSILVGACGSGAAARERCEAIAMDGCPGNSLAACADEACAFVASCDLATGKWMPVGVCGRRDAGAARDGGLAGDGAVLADASTAGAADAAATPEGGSSAGCPPLQLPDCAESTRAACGAGCCGCEDVFACVRGGWEYVGPCVSP